MTAAENKQLMQHIFAELSKGNPRPIAGPITVTAHRFIAEGDHVVIEGRGHATTKAGATYDNTYCWVYRLAQAKAQEVTEYLDTELVTAALGK